MGMDITTTKGIIVERNEMLNTYLKDINKYKVLSPDEEVELFYAMRNGDSSAREKIINSNYRFVFAIAKRYATDYKLIDLVSEGNIGLLEAIDSFDPTVGTRFLTHAVWFIRRRIVRFLIEEANLIRKTNSNKTQFHISKIKNKFFCENGRYPTTDELIAIFDKEYNITIQDTSDLDEVEMQSINTTFDNDDANAFENSAAFTTRTASINEFEIESDREENSNMVSKLLSCLKERDRVIMSMLFGIGYEKEYTAEEVGDIMDLTPERVRQIRKNACLKMRKMAVMCEN